MQLVKKSVNFSTVITALMFASLASAQVTMPLAIPLSPAAPKDSIAVTAKGVVIGKSEMTKGDNSGTLKELENLQRESFLAELRSKIRQADPDTKDSKIAAPPIASRGAIGVIPGTRLQPIVSPYSRQSAPYFHEKIQINDGTIDPTAQLVNVIVANGKARADVIDEGVIKTVTKGSSIGLWTVINIEPGEVKVERVIKKTQPDSNKIPVLNTSKKNKKTAKKGLATTVSQGTKILTASLKLYQPQEPRFQIGSPPASLPLPIIPPLPSQIKITDSTSNVIKYK